MPRNEHEQSTNQTSDYKEPPLPPKGGVERKSAVELKTFLAECKSRGEKAILDDDPVFDFCDKAGIHEAGHALAHIRFGIMQGRATIVSNGQNLGSVSAEDSNWNADEAAVQIIALCAGYGALKALGYDDQAAMHGADNDFDKASRLIDFWGLGNLEAWMQKAVELMRSPENVKALELLSTALEVHQTLGASYMDLLVNFSDGEISEGDWLRYVDVILPSRGITPSTND